MVYISSWQEYQEAAEALYLKSPNKTRYCVKWKASEGKLVLKITDDVTCLKYKTHSSIFLNRFEALNLSLMEKMQNRQPPPPAATTGDVEMLNVEGGAAIGRAATASPAPGGGTGAGAGGAKKKKGGKKKK